MNVELEKFITDLDEHLKKVNTVTDEHINKLCEFIGDVVIKQDQTGNLDGFPAQATEQGIRFKDLLKDNEELKKELRNIVTGARADLIYEYQAFVENLVKAEESENSEDED